MIYLEFLFSIWLVLGICVQSQENVNCVVSEECLGQQCFEYLIIWDELKRLVICDEIAQTREIKKSLVTIFPEKVYEEPATVLELWSIKLHDYFQLMNNTYMIPPNSKINVKQIQNVAVSSPGVYANPNITYEKLITGVKMEQDLHYELLSNYDKNVWPWQEMNSSCLVKINIMFHKIIDVDLQHGSLSMLVWFRLRWNDPRLTWDPQDWNGIDSIYVKQDDIWDPEIEIWNSEDSIERLLQEQKASVSYRGDIFWCRLGQIRISCGMEGLAKFPYDQSQCKFEVGSWAYDITKVELGIHLDGYQLDNSTTSNKYAPFAQYNIPAASVSVYIYPPFDVYPEINSQERILYQWPAVIYNITIRRHHMQYTYGIIVPQGLLTVLSFAAFFLPPSSGERLGFTITIPLAIAVYKILMYESLPAAAELVYASKLSFGCFLFTIIVVAESVFVAMLWHRTDPYFLSPWRSFRKLIIDFYEMSDWVNIIKAIDVEMTHRKVEGQSSNLYQSIQWRFYQTMGSMKKIVSSRGEKPTQNQSEIRNDGVNIHNLGAHVVLAIPYPNYEQELKKAYSFASSSSSRKFEGSNFNQGDIQCPSYISKYFKDQGVEIDDVVSFPIQTVDNARRFLSQVLIQPRYSNASKSYERLCKRYSIQNVENDLFQLMGVVDGAMSDFANEAKNRYNPKWQKLSNIIDRVCQITVIPAFFVFVLVITLQVVD